MAIVKSPLHPRPNQSYQHRNVHKLRARAEVCGIRFVWLRVGAEEVEAIFEQSLMLKLASATISSITIKAKNDVRFATLPVRLTFA